MKASEARKIVLSREPPSIDHKSEYFALYKAGFFGNRVKTWQTYKEILDSEWKGQVCMRSSITQTKTIYNIDIENVPKEIEKWTSNGIPLSTINFNQSMNDKLLKIQGEIMLSTRGLYVFYTTVKKPMKDAFDEYYEKRIAIRTNKKLNEQEKQKQLKETEKLAQHIWGLEAKMLLQKNMDIESYADLETLLELFPNNIIEFSSWDYNVGDLKRNTIFWEVRNY